MDKTKKPGPDPERLEIEGDWEKASQKAVRKEKPKEGWPNRESVPPKGTTKKGRG